MQQPRTLPIGRSGLRLLMALAWLAAAMALPVTTARACSCGMADLPTVIDQAEVAFIGTAIDHRDTGASGFSGPLVETAFRVDRASAPTPDITLVRAGTSGASCGMSFGLGEEWLVVLPARADLGDMEGDTHLCAGNTHVADIPPGDRRALEKLLTVTPTAAPAAPAAAEPAPIVFLAVGTALIALTAIGLVVVARGRAR